MLITYFLLFLGWLVLEGLTVLVTNYWMDGRHSATARRLRLQLTVLWLFLAGLILGGLALADRSGAFGAT